MGKLCPARPARAQRANILSLAVSRRISSAHCPVQCGSVLPFSPAHCPRESGGITNDFHCPLPCVDRLCTQGFALPTAPAVQQCTVPRPSPLPSAPYSDAVCRQAFIAHDHFYDFNLIRVGVSHLRCAILCYPQSLQQLDIGNILTCQRYLTICTSFFLKQGVTMFLSCRHCTLVLNIMYTEHVNDATHFLWSQLRLICGVELCIFYFRTVLWQISQCLSTTAKRGGHGCANEALGYLACTKKPSTQHGAKAQKLLSS